MKAKDVIIGEIYLAKISGKLQSVKVIQAGRNGGWVGTNLATGRIIRFRNSARLRPLNPTN